MSDQLSRKKVPGRFKRLFSLKKSLVRFFETLRCWSYRKFNPAFINISGASVSNEFGDLMSRYGSDKSTTHNYHAIYSMLFSEERLHVRAVLECGIGSSNPLIPSNMGPEGVSGASLFALRAYFENAHITGIDIDPDCQIFGEDRITTAIVDQTSSSSTGDFFKDFSLGHFDLIIDDGLHTLDAMASLLSASAPFLSREGIYIIEDAGINEALGLKKYLRKQGYQMTFTAYNADVIRFKPSYDFLLVLSPEPRN